MEKRPIKFFCCSCGKEIWQMMDYEYHYNETLFSLFQNCFCSDCFLEDIKEENIHKETKTVGKEVW